MTIQRLLVAFTLILLTASNLYAKGFNVAILMYHKFGEDRYPSTSVTLEQFDTHLAYLEQNGFQVFSLVDIADAYRNRTDLPDKCVAITVDDAYASVYEHAYPRMKKRNWPFTVFVATDSVDKGYPAMMNWDQIREMQKNGVLFANHTATHDHLIQRKTGESADEHRQRVQKDIGLGQQRLIDELGSAPMLFAYPYGEFNAKIAAYLESAGYLAFGQHSGAMGLNSNPVALPRFPVNEHYGDINDLRDKLNSLAMPINSQTPFDPVTIETQPTLEISLDQTDMGLDELTCFISGQGQAVPKWVAKGRRFTIQAAKPLPMGRSRYTCTAPNKERTRYYWFSHQWVVVDEIGQ